jgi:hypothetical protein
VILKKYQSINTETISDRIVEPFGFTENYQTVMAYELASEKNKTYNIDRIGSVEYLDIPFKNEDKHEQQIPDVFGFAYSGNKHLIELELSLKNFLLLKNDYPLTAPFVKYNSIKNNYELKIYVNDLKAIHRYIKGLDLH